MKQYTFIQEQVLLNENNFLISDDRGNSIGTIEVRFREGCGKKHYHINSDKLGGKICLLMDKPLYYFHDNWKDKFVNKKAKQFFNKFLDSTSCNTKFKNKKETNWEFFKRVWNIAHQNDPIYARIPENLKHPDYTKLP